MFGIKHTCSKCGMSYKNKDEFESHNNEVHDGDAGSMPG